MRIDLSDRDWINARRLWHRWFAWHPVIIGDHLFWLEWVERRGGFDHSKNIDRRPPWRWQYRTAEEKAA